MITAPYFRWLLPTELLLDPNLLRTEFLLALCSFALELLFLSPSSFRHRLLFVNQLQHSPSSHHRTWIISVLSAGRSFKILDPKRWSPGHLTIPQRLFTPRHITCWCLIWYQPPHRLLDCTASWSLCFQNFTRASLLKTTKNNTRRLSSNPQAPTDTATTYVPSLYSI